MKREHWAVDGGSRSLSPARRATARALDEALEFTVIGSWSRLGIAVRRSLWQWPDHPVAPGSLVGKEVLVTGGTSGIGRAAATALIAAGASVGLVGRELDRAEAAAKAVGRDAAALASQIRGEAGSVWAASADLSSLGHVARLAEDVGGRSGQLHALVHAAGLLNRSFGRSAEGTELTAAVHVVGPHLLTAELTPLLAAGGTSIVLWVSSGGMYLEPLDPAHLEMTPEDYKGAAAYARAKRAQVALARLWNERLAGAGVAALAMHPGWVDTAALSHGLPRFARWFEPLLRTPEEGADTVVWLAGGAGGTPPGSNLWFDRSPRAERRWPFPGTTKEAEDQLWAWCEEKTNGAGEAALQRLHQASQTADQESDR